MKKTDKPSKHFVGAILRGFDKAETEQSGSVTCSAIWDYMVMECPRRPDGFKIVFAWDTSKAKKKNRIGDIMECIERGHVPGLRLKIEGRSVVERY